MKHVAVKRLATIFAKYRLHARGDEGSTTNDLAIGPYVRLNNDRRKGKWISRRVVVRWLEQYYATHHPITFGSRLILKRLGIFGSFLIVTQDSDILDLLSVKERKNRLKVLRTEFAHFGKYLERQKNAKKHRHL
jgi:hypothetical protein